MGIEPTTQDRQSRIVHHLLLHRHIITHVIFPLLVRRGRLELPEAEATRFTVWTASQLRDTDAF